MRATGIDMRNVRFRGAQIVGTRLLHTCGLQYRCVRPLCTRRGSFGDGQPVGHSGVSATKITESRRRQNAQFRTNSWTPDGAGPNNHRQALAGASPRQLYRHMTATADSTKLIVLLEYWQSFGGVSVREQLEYWELDGPRYLLNVQQFASPDGDGHDAWISAEIAEKLELSRLLEDWARARRVGTQVVADARGALSQLILGPVGSAGLAANAGVSPRSRRIVDEAVRPRRDGATPSPLAPRPSVGRMSGD